MRTILHHTALNLQPQRLPPRSVKLHRQIARNATSDCHQTAHQKELSTRQRVLYYEASSLTRALYRRCLKSIKLLSQCNQRDEREFAARENSELAQFSNDPSSTSKQNASSLMSPPVNRTNELSSRANYYAGFCREHFEGHWNLLGLHGFHIGSGSEAGVGHVVGGQMNNRYQGGHHHLGGQMAAQYVGRYGVANNEKEDNNMHYTWREEQIEQFIYLIRSGEEKRSWILKDYDFVDPFVSDGWPQQLEKRLEQFEHDTNLLLKEMYRGRGWVHSGDVKVTMADDEDSDDDDDL